MAQSSPRPERTDSRVCAVASWYRREASGCRLPDTGLREGVGEAKDAALRDDAGDELGRRHVEGGVVDRRGAGSGLSAAGAAHFARVALLNGDVLTRCDGRVDRGEWRRDVKGKVVMPGQDRHRVGPDLVGRIAV